MIRLTHASEMEAMNSIVFRRLFLLQCSVFPSPHYISQERCERTMQMSVCLRICWKVLNEGLQLSAEGGTMERRSETENELDFLPGCWRLWATLTDAGDPVIKPEKLWYKSGNQDGIPDTQGMQSSAQYTAAASLVLWKRKMTSRRKSVCVTKQLPDH